MVDLSTPRFLQMLRDTIIKAVRDVLGSFVAQWEVSNKLVWRIGDVAEQINLSESTIRNFLDSEGPYFDAEFPKPIRLGNGAGLRSAIGWRRTDIVAWVDTRPTHEMSHQVDKKFAVPNPSSGGRKSMAISRPCA